MKYASMLAYDLCWLAVRCDHGSLTVTEMGAEPLYVTCSRVKPANRSLSGGSGTDRPEKPIPEAETERVVPSFCLSPSMPWRYTDTVLDWVSLEAPLSVVTVR